MRSAGQAECDQNGNPIRMRGIGQDITQQKLMRDVLKKSEELYRNTFQTSLDAININRMNDGVYINVNEAFLKTLGYARDEVIGRSSLDLNIWADNSDRKHLVEILLRNSVCPNIEARFRCKNGNIIWGLMSASIIIVDNEPCILSITRDITERKFAEEQLRLWGDSFEKAEFGLAMADATTNEFVYVNPTFARERGYSRDELVGKPIMTVFPYQVHDQINSMISELDVATHITYESVHICKDGRQFPVLLDITNIKSEAGVPTRRIAYAMDITQRKKLEENQRISAIAFESQDGIFITDANGLILSVNRSFTRITGYLPNDVTGKNPRILSSGRQNIDFYVAMWKSINTLGYWEGEIWNKRKNGEIYPEYLTIKAVKDGQEVVTNYVASLTDISRRIEAEKQVQNLAHFDQLTGLPNRTLLNEHFQYALSFSQRSNGPLAVLFLDLDHFKDINDTLGHSIGDLILMEAARRLKTILREQDTLSRQGGDEFILILPGSDADGAALVASKLIDVVSQPCVIEQHELIITPSIGIAIYPNDGETLELLSKNADAAMYRAKHSGRNNFRFFTPEMQAQSSRNLTLANALRHAIERNEMQLHYQPQLSIQDGHIIGVEALLRWQNSELGNISPTEFIPIAENNGQIIKIGEWVLSTAVRQLKHWIDIGYSPLIMAVNLSAVQFRQNNLPELVTRILEAEKLPPQYLELELTEAAAMDNPQAAIEMMNRLNELGIRMSIDDFGTGYSSLSYLKKFKVYKLKIDQSFVRDLTEDPEDKAIVTAIINMANGLGLQTIAEGVETSNQLAFLRLQGCNEVQGYYFSKPLAPSQFEEFVREYLMSR
jgi:diguanylate cyclase (GGDEF)-like protein/PAS domain S-box-containing protein